MKGHGNFNGNLFIICSSVYLDIIEEGIAYFSIHYVSVFNNIISGVICDVMLCTRYVKEMMY
jgi:hypothetical protein